LALRPHFVFFFLSSDHHTLLPISFAATLGFVGGRGACMLSISISSRCIPHPGPELFSLSLFLSLSFSFPFRLSPALAFPLGEDASTTLADHPLAGAGSTRKKLRTTTTPHTHAHHPPIAKKRAARPSRPRRRRIVIPGPAASSCTSTALRHNRYKQASSRPASRHSSKQPTHLSRRRHFARGISVVLGRARWV
jgi:hypothetical protein